MNNTETKAPQGVGTEDLFDRCVRRKVRSTGMILIECRLGLWSIEGPDHAFVESNARHYWVQYHADGEYAQLLPNAEIGHGLRLRGYGERSGSDMRG